MLSADESDLASIPAYAGFNPFQGIQVLSERESIRLAYLQSWVSIPFREFKCCRSHIRPLTKLDPEFQSLSGNSSVVGRHVFHGFDLPGGFNPFQGIQVLSVG